MKQALDNRMAELQKTEVSKSTTADLSAQQCGQIRTSIATPTTSNLNKAAFFLMAVHGGKRGGDELFDMEASRLSKVFDEDVQK